MPIDILILQSHPEDVKPICEYFQKRNSEVFVTDDLSEACIRLEEIKPRLFFIDLHYQSDDWLNVIECAHKKSPKTGLIATNKYPDLRRELLAQERGVKVFLRTPFTSVWIEKSIRNLRETSLEPQRKYGERKIDLPKVKLPMRIKITFPYAILALIFALAGSYLVSRYVLESLKARFNAQLIDAGVMTADWMVQEENRILETIRLINNTEGVSEAMAVEDAEVLRGIVLPIAVNYGEEIIEFVNLQGISALSIRKKTESGPTEYSIFYGDSLFGSQVSVQRVLIGVSDARGDKFAGFVRSNDDSVFYISAPIFNNNGNLVGAIVVGKSFSALLDEIRKVTLAHITIYTREGTPMGSTLFSLDDVYPLMTEQINTILINQDQSSFIRDLNVASVNYSEILGAWEVRGGEDLGVIGVSLAQNFFISPTLITQVQAIGFILLMVCGVVILGIFVAHQITQPLESVVNASVKIAQGDLDIRVPSKGNDEVMVLAHAFNHMVSGLQEGFIYRDLLGRTVSPEVREALRFSFASGEVKLEGQSTIATVLMSDIRGFTSLSESEEPTVVLNWLNEYFSEIVPVITSYGGVVDKFEGDAMLSFFGILPKPVSPEESAYQACQAALAMLNTIENINNRRVKRGEPVFITGVGINTGSLTAGGLGTSDRLNYTIIGDTVNTTQRLEGVTREFGESGIVISEHTLEALGEFRANFLVKPLGERVFKGKRELVWVYRLYPQSERDVEDIILEPAGAAD